MSLESAAQGVIEAIHVNALINAKNGQLLPVLTRIADSLEQIKTTGAASASATAEIETEKADTHQLSLEERLAILNQQEAALQAEYVEVGNAD